MFLGFQGTFTYSYDNTYYGYIKDISDISIVEKLVTINYYTPKMEIKNQLDNSPNSQNN